jgi:hypothetical protein
LENTLVKLILSLEFYEKDGRTKIAIGAEWLHHGIHPTSDEPVRGAPTWGMTHLLVFPTAYKLPREAVCA